MEQTTYVLEMHHITKEFPGVKALDDVTLKIEPGKVHALMGENGAGKSTLMKCLFGIYQADAGEGSEVSQRPGRSAGRNLHDPSGAAAGAPSDGNGEPVDGTAPQKGRFFGGL